MPHLHPRQNEKSLLIGQPGQPLHSLGRGPANELIASGHFPGSSAKDHHGQFATLFAGSTIAEYRKQGLYTSLLATRLREIRERGYQFAVVEAGPMSKPIVSKHGFKHLTTVYDYEWKGN